MILKIGLLLALFGLSLSDKDDKKWVWGSNNRDNQESSRTVAFGSSPSARYEVFENENRPNLLNDRPFNAPYQERPINNIPFVDRPLINEGPIRPPFSPSGRPGGVYGPGNFGSSYGQGHGIYQNNGNTYHPEDGVLTGPIPSWEKQGPIKNFDRCKCAEKFNCNSPGISYGHCDVGKQYCCYSIKKSSQIGGPIPSRPVHSPENGILVGPGGPVDRPLGPIGRPPGPIGGSFGQNYNRPGFRPNAPYTRPNYRPGNTHSLDNGILIGPGGPFDIPRPQGFGGFERSAKKD